MLILYRIYFNVIISFYTCILVDWFHFLLYMCIGRLVNVFQDKYVFEYDPGFFTTGGSGDQDDTDAARKRVGQACYLPHPRSLPLGIPQLGPVRWKHANMSGSIQGQREPWARGFIITCVTWSVFGHYPVGDFKSLWNTLRRCFGQKA